MHLSWLRTPNVVRLALAAGFVVSSSAVSAASVERPLNPSTPAATDSQEIALALTAAPVSLTATAVVYVLRDGHFVKAREGATGISCMVSRDTRYDGVFPMCFDPEGSRTLMREEMLKTKLWGRHLSDSAVKREVDAAYANGTLHHPDKPAMIYMMSSHQMLVADGQLIGAWHPHVMVYLPHAAPTDFALGKDGEAGPVSVPFSDAGGVQMVVQVPHWADDPAHADNTVAKRGR
jgi:hypothetical protein